MRRIGFVVLFSQCEPLMLLAGSCAGPSRSQADAFGLQTCAMCPFPSPTWGRIRFFELFPILLAIIINWASTQPCHLRACTRRAGCLLRLSQGQ